MSRELTRREVLAAAAAVGATTALPFVPGPTARAAGLAFTAAPDGEGWGPGWRTTGVANVFRSGGEGVLEAGSDVFPNDPRPVAFAVHSRFRDGTVGAVLTRPGRAPGVVLRRVGPGAHYAAVYDSEAAALLIVRRTEDASAEIARAGAPVAARAPLTVRLEATGARPTRLVATIEDADGRQGRAETTDGTPALQAAGDPGVLATAQTFLTVVESEISAFGSARLGFFGTQEGMALAGTPAGQAYVDAVRERSTAAFREITIATAERLRRTPPAVVAATTTLPAVGGATLNIASDLPADVSIEISRSPTFTRPRTVRAGRTGDFDVAAARTRGLEPGRRAYWRARLRDGGLETVGPARSFRVLPAPGDRQPVSIAVGACASRFGPIFDHLARWRPDVFVWQGDLNYPDTHGPLAQTTSGYAGIWRDFRRNPRMAPILERAAFVPHRDDHDFGVQDANSEFSAPWGFAPWDALMAGARHHRFAAGLVEMWVLDERTEKTPPQAPDTPAKTLLGSAQRDWLLRTLASSRAPFKVICSPCTLHYGQNERDGNWNAGYVAERDLILDHIARRVSGRTIFLTGDAHDTMVYDRGGVFEARACPLDIPDPRDHPGVLAGMFGGEGVVYASTAGHFAVIEASGGEQTAVMRLSLVREDGAIAFTKRFHAPLRRRRPQGRRRRRRARPRPPRFTG